jgi:hypothetical protein
MSRFKSIDVVVNIERSFRHDHKLVGKDLDEDHTPLPQVAMVLPVGDAVMFGAEGAQRGSGTGSSWICLRSAEANPIRLSRVGGGCRGRRGGVG